MRVLAVVWLGAWALVGFPWRSLTAQPSFEHVRLIPFEDRRIVTQVLNVVAFVPWGVAATGLGWSVTRAIASGGAISLATEASQVFSTRRYPTTNDVLLNTLGAAIGAALTRRVRRRAARS